MVQNETSHAFERALLTADNETLRAAIAEWFNQPYRTPANALDIAPIVQSAMDASFALKIDEAKRNWRNTDAEAWNQGRQSFDASMCAFVETMSKQPNPDPIDDKWGDPSQRPAIGAGWGVKTA